MEPKPIGVLVDEYKQADQHYLFLLHLKVALLPTSIARRYGLPVYGEEGRKRGRAKFHRLGGERGFEEAERHRCDLRREIAERLAQQSSRDAAAEPILEVVSEYISVKREASTERQSLGKIPRLPDGKRTRALLRTWFGPGRYLLDYVRDGDHEEATVAV